jgi:hypothetical protein
LQFALHGDQGPPDFPDSRWHAACSRQSYASVQPSSRRSHHMPDLIFILVTLGFFALAAGYVRGCELM